MYTISLWEGLITNEYIDYYFKVVAFKTEINDEEWPKMLQT